MKPIPGSIPEARSTNEVATQLRGVVMVVESNLVDCRVCIARVSPDRYSAHSVV